jgi:hypothetical protein
MACLDAHLYEIEYTRDCVMLFAYLRNRCSIYRTMAGYWLEARPNQKQWMCH